MQAQLLKALEGAEVAVPFHELMKAAGVPAKKNKEAKRALKALVRTGKVEREKGRRFRLSRSGTELEGVVELDAQGQPRVRLDGYEEERALPVEGADVDRVGEGDRVRVLIEVQGRQGRHFARITSVEELSRPVHVGVFQTAGGARFVEIELSAGGSRGRRARDVIVARKDDGGAEAGDLVQVELQRPDPKRPSTPTGKVLRVLGRPGDRDAEMLRLMIEHNLMDDFPPDALREAEEFGPEPSPSDIEGRRDLRNLSFVTIDGITAKDFDDAVYAEPKGRGFILYVAIADVSHYVRPGTPLDEEAYRRATSTYLTDRAIPMLPEALSNGLCSLKPNVDRLCMVAEIHIDAQGRATTAKFDQAVMNSKARLTYTQVAAALLGDPDTQCKPLLPQILLLSRVASKLLGQRLRRGSIDLDLPETEIIFEDGKPTTARRRARNDAHRLIEDLMLAANEAVARFFVSRELPTLFRVHGPPDRDKLQVLLGLCEHLGLDLNLSERPPPGEVARLLEKLATHPFGRTLHGLMLRAMAQARYFPDNEGHYGLAAEAYLHFTSPIRRYPDLIVHRMLKDALAKRTPRYDFKRLAPMGEHCSDREREAMKAERESMDLDRAVIAQKFLGEIGPAEITGLVHFGMFASFEKPYVEGLIPMRLLPQGSWWEMDEYGSMLVDERSGQSFVLGDTVEVEIVSVDVSRRQVDFKPTEPEASPSSRPVRALPRDSGRPRKRSGPRGKPKSAPSKKRKGDRRGR